jgi:DNA topoisomerase-3
VEKNMLYSTNIAEKLFDALPESLAYPDITAIWEDKLARIAKNNFSAEAFLDSTTDFVKTLLGEAKGKTISVIEGQILCPVCKKGILKRRSGKKQGTFFWGCSCYPDCQTRYSDKRGKPDIG